MKSEGLIPLLLWALTELSKLFEMSKTDSPSATCSLAFYTEKIDRKSESTKKTLRYLQQEHTCTYFPGSKMANSNENGIFYSLCIHSNENSLNHVRSAKQQ